MENKRIHIVSLDVPFPPDYGGVIDIFHRCAALKKAGFYVVLHCFEYGRGTHIQTHPIADEIHYYRRKKSIFAVFNPLPFIISTRISEDLAQKLIQDTAPIILEGHHCAGLLLDKRFDSRIRMVRIHNNEPQYYLKLAEKASGWKRWFFQLEAKKIARFEKHLSKASALICLNETEQKKYSSIHPKTFLAPLGVDPQPIEKQSIVEQAFFHGNLSVPENSEVANWLIAVWNKQTPKIPLILAGKNPSQTLVSQAKGNSMIHLIANPSEEKMKQLISESAIHLLFTFQTTGVKVKLIHGLIHGNRCLVNPPILAGTNLDSYGELIQNESELLQKLTEIGPNETEITLRQEAVKKLYSTDYYVHIVNQIVSAVGGGNEQYREIQ